MKSVITAICLLITIVIIFVIIDRKDFYSGDDVAVQQKTVMGKTPMMTTIKPVETKSAEIKPAEVKPIEVKPLERSSTETEPKAEMKNDTKLNPVAVPVVTAEEATKLNEEAKAYAVAEQEKREPFYKLYQNIKLNTFYFEGTVRAVSVIPDPTKNDYDNCLYTLFVEIDALLSEVSPDTDIPSKAIVTAPIMKDKIILQDNKFYPGDKVQCSCAEYDTMPQAIQEIQVSDDIQSYEHKQYYSLRIRKISAFQKDRNRNFAKRVITVLPIQPLPKDEKSSMIRREHIQSEITRIEDEIKKHGGSFESWKEEYKPIVKKYKTLCNEQYKGWIKNSYFAAGGATYTPPTYNTQAYINGILPYKKYLEDNNIDLILVRIPTKWEFARCVLTSDEFQEDPTWVEHYYNCLKNDIEIIDPMQSMWEHRFDFPLFYFYNEPSESHPFEGQAFVSAMVLSDVLRRYSFIKSEQPIELEDYVNRSTKKHYFWPEGNNEFNPEENIRFKHVIRDQKSIGQLAVNTGSPFLFLSNSFFWYPWRDAGASVPAYTAFFIQHVPDWFYQSGGGNAMIRTILGKDALSKRKAVIMVGHPSFWKGSDFPKFPKYLQDNAKSVALEKTLNLIDDELLSEGKECYVFTKDEDGTITFITRGNSVQSTSNAVGKFNAKVSIPPLNDKNTCMIRLIFKSCSDLIIDALSEDNSLIDTFTLAPSTHNITADLFIPISNKPTNVTLRFTSRSTSKYILQDIELWYY